MTNVQAVYIGGISSMNASHGFTLVLSTFKDHSLSGDWAYVVGASNDDGSSPLQLSLPGLPAPEVVAPWTVPPVGASVAAGVWRFPLSPATTAQYLTVSSELTRDIRFQLFLLRGATLDRDRVQVGPAFSTVPATGNQKATAPGLTVNSPVGSAYGFGVMWARLESNTTVPSTFTPPDNAAQVAGQASGNATVPSNIMTGKYNALADGTTTKPITFTATSLPYAGRTPGSVIGFQVIVPSEDGDPRPGQTGYDNMVSVDGWSATDGPVPAVDAHGNTWIIQDLEGWFGNVDVRSGDIDKPLADGVFGGPAPFAGRTITVTGTVVSRSRMALQAAFDVLAGVLAGVNRSGTFVVNEVVRQVIKQATVRLGGPMLLSRTSDVTAKFSLPLFAADPNRYGVELHSQAWLPYQISGGRAYDLVPPRSYGTGGRSGVATLANNGDRMAWPVFKIAYTATNPAVRLAGGPMLKVMTTLAYNESLTIDTGRRTVSVGDYSRRVLLSSDSEWFALPPGPSDLYYSTENPADYGLITALWRDTYS